MLAPFLTAWPLLLGTLLMMLGNGMQGTLLGIRGDIEGFATFQLSVVVTAYFVGFLIGSRLVPHLIRRVGHVRVLAALGAVISALLVLYPVLPDWRIWTVMRVFIGIGFAGFYITAESWVNNTATNANRGQLLSAYMIMQMLGIVIAQGLLTLTDADSYEAFLIPAVLVSLAFVPLLLSGTRTPAFESTATLGFRELFRISPLGCVAMLISGGVFSAMFGMASVFGTMHGMSVEQIAVFIAALYVGGVVLQYPIGRLSDRMDRRKVMLGLAIIAAATMAVATVLPLPFWALLPVAALLGGITYPMYSLILAYTNDHVDKEQMAGTSAGLTFLNGFGAIFGPVLLGWLMGAVGSRGFFLFIGVLYGVQVLYTLWRMRRRPAGASGNTAFRGVSPLATSLAVGAVMQEADDSPPAPPIDPR